MPYYHIIISVEVSARFDHVTYLMFLFIVNRELGSCGGYIRVKKYLYV